MRGGLLQSSRHRAASLSQSPLLQCPHRRFAHVHSPRPGQKYQCWTNIRSGSCRTILSYSTSGQTRRLELLLPLASSTTRSSKATFERLRGLLSQVSLISTLIEHATAQTVVLRILTPIVRIFPDYDFPAEGGLFLPRISRSCLTR